MGASLIERANPLMLTEAGKTTLNMATTILSAANAAKREIAMGSACENDPALTIEDTFYCPCFSEFIYRYSHDATMESLPRIEVRALAKGKGSFECLLERRLDFAFLSNVGIEGAPVELPNVPRGLVTLPLPHSIARVCFLVSKNNPLAQREEVTLADFSTTPIMMPVSMVFDYERRTVVRLCEEYGGFSPVFDWQQVNTLQEFFSLNPGASAFFTTEALVGRYQQYSSWVIKNTVALLPKDATYIRQLFLVHRDSKNEQLLAAVKKICDIWAEEGYYGEG